MGCAGSKSEIDYNEIYIDNVEPNDREKKFVQEIAPLMERTEEVLYRLSQYKGCAEYIKMAVKTPSVENDVNAWNAVVPAVCMLKDFFDFYDEFQKALLNILGFICTDDPFISLPENLFSAKLIVNMFDFIIKFDELKMGKASIQNDFSFYRRSMNRMKRGDVLVGHVEKAPVNDEVANRMSLFFAYPNPFTKALIDAFMGSDLHKPHLTRCFALIANGCKAMAERSNDKPKNFGLFRAMVAAILFYDYVHPNGVFIKKSDVDVVGCITALKRYDGDAMDLLNTIRYGTHTFNSETTTKRIVDIMSL